MRTLEKCARMFEVLWNLVYPALGINTSLEVLDDGWLMHFLTRADFTVIYSRRGFRRELRELLGDDQNDPFSWRFNFERVPRDTPERELANEMRKFYENDQLGGEFSTVGSYDGRTFYEVRYPSLSRFVKIVEYTISLVKPECRKTGAFVG
ncbi:MAG: hypothetical protein Kow0069_26650 [Promethearchaeota archaeon]